ncbi:hypothetical protein CUMW_225630 [Citrus unshiu]|uniref:Uncharacterized protein n=1 Tax=Citrus unshiu TaxID=55188 RepID=A0A2H5QFS4_CITUN|nr:hypothetical protein CUMW_225630 [Citrus unshiu]
MPLSSNSAIAFTTLPIPVPSIPRPQAKMAAELAVKDGRKLMVSYYWIIEELYAHIDCRISIQFMMNKYMFQEIEFPTAGLDSVPGDGEGGIEMTGSMRLIREFCDLFVTPEKVTRTRIIWSSPDKFAKVMRLPAEELPFGNCGGYFAIGDTTDR